MKNYNIPASYDTLNPDQKAIFQMLKYGYDSGQNYVLMGDAGVGKSYLSDVFTEFCDMNSINIVKAAPTGVAATNIKGVTLHKLFRLPLHVLTEKLDGNQWATIHKTLKYADIVYIDEIGMVRIDIFDNIMAQIQAASKVRMDNGENPIQVILSGDFGQLMPVITDEDRKNYRDLTGKNIGTGLCYGSHFWTDMDFKPLILSQHMRQSDAAFCRALDNIKIGVKSDMDFINANSAQAPVKDGIWLCGYNNTAAEKNAKGLYNLPGDMHICDAIVTGKANIKHTNFAERLMYKNGARVMMIMKDPMNKNFANYCNGSLGTITAVGSDHTVKIRLDSGSCITVGRVKIPFIEYTVKNGRVCPSEIGSIEQLPFKIGYAVTIHKSQGQTYDAMNLVPEIFTPGQLYVALSRCRDLGRIYIQPDGYGRKLTPEKIMPNQEVVRFLISQDAEYAKYRSWYENTVGITV